MEQQCSPQGPSSKGHSRAVPAVTAASPEHSDTAGGTPSPAFDDFSLPTVNINNFREGILPRAGPPLIQLQHNEKSGGKKGFGGSSEFGDVLALCTPPPAIPGSCMSQTHER